MYTYIRKRPLAKFALGADTEGAHLYIYVYTYTYRHTYICTQDIFMHIHIHTCIHTPVEFALGVDVKIER